MKKLGTALAMLLSATMLFSGITAFADTDGDKVLTLEEAKQLALKSNILYEHQQDYIDEAQENYDEVYDDNTGSADVDLSSIADEVEYLVGRKIAIEAAASETRTAVLKRTNLKRTSDYNVTVAYYDAISANYALDDAKNDMDLKGKDFEIAKIKLSQGLLTNNGLALYENAYKASQIAYNDAFAKLQNNMNTLGRLIGRKLDVFNDKLDMTLTVPDVKSIDLNKVKEDYMKNSEGFFKLQEQVGIAEYRVDLTQEKYDYYYKKLKNRKSSKSIKQMNDMLYDYLNMYDDAQYQLDQKEEELDVTLSSAYTGLNNLMASVENLQKSLADKKVTFEHDKIKYEQGLLSKIDFEKSEVSLKTLENQLNTTLATLNTKYAELMQYSGTVEETETAK